MNDVKKMCLNCKYFRLESVDKGICRVDKEKEKNYPAKEKNEACERWLNCGQQYYIRLGWIKAKTTKSE
jgi:hypothetical protein